MNTSINAVTAPEWGRDEPEMGDQCDRFESKQHRSIDVGKQQNKIQEIIAKILEKNSDRTSLMERKSLLMNLNQIPMERRKEVIMQITKNLKREQNKKNKKVSDGELGEDDEAVVMRSTQKHKSEMSLKGSPSKESKMHSSKRSS